MLVYTYNKKRQKIVEPPIISNNDIIKQKPVFFNLSQISGKIVENAQSKIIWLHRVDR